MIKIGDLNLIRLEDTGNIVLSKLISYFDILGKNVIIFAKEDSLVTSFNKTITYIDVDDLLQKMESNLFRVNYIFVESDYNIIKTIREVTELPVTFLCDEDSSIRGDFDNEYRLFIERSGYKFGDIRDVDNDYMIDIKGDVLVSLDQIKRIYCRNSKIDGLLSKLSMIKE